MRDFKKLEIWQRAMDIIDMVYDIFEEITWQQAGRLKNQSTDAASSVAANIAEGCSRRSEKEKYRFVEIALGSAFELETHLLVVQRRKWISPERLDPILAAVVIEQKQVMAYMNSLNS